MSKHTRSSEKQKTDVMRRKAADELNGTEWTRVVLLVSDKREMWNCIFVTYLSRKETKRIERSFSYFSVHKLRIETHWARKERAWSSVIDDAGCLYLEFGLIFLFKKRYASTWTQLISIRVSPQVLQELLITKAELFKVTQVYAARFLSWKDGWRGNV